MRARQAVRHSSEQSRISSQADEYNWVINLWSYLQPAQLSEELRIQQCGDMKYARGLSWLNGPISTSVRQVIPAKTKTLLIQHVRVSIGDKFSAIFDIFILGVLLFVRVTTQQYYVEWISIQFSIA